MALCTFRKNPVKRNQIVSFIRGQIYSGFWKPGEKLPPRTWFRDKFDAVPLTMQSAFQQLIDAKILVTVPRVGTRINPDISALYQYAVLIYSTCPQDCETHSLQLAISMAVRQGLNIESFRISRAVESDKSIIELYRGIRDSYYTGIFLDSDPTPLVGSTIFSECEVPLTGFFPSAYRLDNMHEPCTLNGRGDVLDRAMFDYLRVSGCRNPVVLDCAEQYDTARESDFAALASASGMNFSSGAYQCVPRRNRDFILPVLKLLFAPESVRRPDSLVVKDDNLLPYVVSVLQSCFGEHCTDAVKIVSMGNYPGLRRYAVPVKYFGLDRFATLINSFNYMTDIRCGRSVHVPEMVIFEEDAGRIQPLTAASAN